MLLLLAALGAISGRKQPFRVLLSRPRDPQRFAARAERLPRRPASLLEAGIKYLILAGLSAAFLLFGMALIYAELGTLEFARIAALLSAISEAPP